MTSIEPDPEPMPESTMPHDDPIPAPRRGPAPPREPALDFPLVPAIRAKKGADGVPTPIGDHTWLLAWGTVAPSLDRLRDKIFEDLTVSGTVPGGAILQVAWTLLVANYHLTDDEVAGLIVQADQDDPKELIATVLDCLFGPEEITHTYSSWVRTSLYGAGLDPAKIPPGDVPAILKWLVHTERAPAAASVIPAVRYAQDEARFKALLRSHGHLEAPASVPEPPAAPEPAG